ASPRPPATARRAGCGLGGGGPGGGAGPAGAATPGGRAGGGREGGAGAPGRGPPAPRAAGTPGVPGTTPAPPAREEVWRDAGGQALLVIGDSRGGLDAQRGEAEAEGGADQQQRGQDHGGVVRGRPHPQEPRVTGGQGREPGRDDPRRAEPVDHRPHPGGGG